jgi:protein involved in polysaccharide export with SLBB domain
MKTIAVVVLVFVVLNFPLIGNAQDILASNDLSGYSAEKLSEADISKIKTQLQFNNVTIEQAEPMILAKGMSKAEYERLKQRLNNEVIDKPLIPVKREFEVVETSISKDSIEKKVFGSDLFNNSNLNFAPTSQLATPINYILGPGDELAISVSGLQELNTLSLVSPEGSLGILHVGEIQVAGMTIEAATQKIKSAISRIYTSVKTGRSQVSITLSRIKSIKVTIIGSKLPGNYTLSSLSTVFNALYFSGGPAVNGSFRNIELLRNNKLLAIIDIYKFLVNGNQADNFGLKDNDVIRIPAYSNRVTLKGNVKVPGVFELKEGETFSDLINFASGFNDVAYTASASIIQKTDKDYKIIDLPYADYNMYKPSSGDVISISAILNRYQNRVSIEGAVFRPATYSFFDGMRLSDLLQKAEGLKEDAYTKRAILSRTSVQLNKEIIDIDLTQIISGNKEADILLQKDDELIVYSILDFKDEKYVTINGEVRNPGKFAYKDSTTLNDLLLQSGGFIGSASKKVEVARMIKSEIINNKVNNRIELFNLEINVENIEQANNFALRPFDVVNIRKMAVYEIPETVSITGAIVNSGIYVLENKIERIRNIVERAGGLTSQANIFGVKIKRPVTPTQLEELQKINIIASSSDSAALQNQVVKKLKDEIRYLVIPVEWDKIQQNSRSSSNVPLMNGDEIEIATQSESVKISGNVVLNSEIPFVKGKGFNYYINAAGGTTGKALKKKSFIVYPNGKAAVTKKLVFFRFPPKVTSGSQIVIPDKPVTKRISTTEIVSFAGVLVGIASVVIAILR